MSRIQTPCAAQPPAVTDMIDNPFVLPGYTNPVDWPMDIFEDVSPNLLRNWEVPLGVIPKPNRDLGYYTRNVHSLVAELDENSASFQFLLERTSDLPSRLLTWLQYATGSRHDITGTLAGIMVHLGGERWWELTTTDGCIIAGQDIYRYTDAVCRYQWRERMNLMPGERLVHRSSSAYYKQEDDDLDPLDLAVLIAMAQGQKGRGVQVDEYTVHVMYPNAAFDHLFMLRAVIPSKTLEAIEREDVKMPPMRICRAFLPRSVLRKSMSSNQPDCTTQPLSLNDIIDNPFPSLKDEHPVQWPDDIFDRVSPTLTRNWEVPKGSIPAPNRDLSYYTEDVQDLIAELNKNRNNFNFLVERTMDLPSRLLTWLQFAKRIQYPVIGAVPQVMADIGGRTWSVKTTAGNHVAEQDIYQYTDAICRYVMRERMRLKPDEWVQRLSSEYPKQDDDDLDPLDLAVLIGMAQRQKSRGVQADEYTVHVLYPNASFDHLFVLRATIPLRTLQAIERNDEKMPPMHICRGVVPLHVDVQKPLRDNMLTKVLAALMDHALNIAATVVEEPSGSASVTVNV
ncbi:hypothetical protein Hypma_004400 [Hypsizygus marmoreus]|uniref:Uncharacterized protein n=1 Tax=Hypsizygus marmoreus TaxID=39966 RepID=A0A369K1E3_HYPMA|nr:hypothetical protein Hypma_004400 [Hypsizygus marmoreus]